MDDLQEIEAAHRSLSDADWEYRRRALAEPELRRRSSFALFADKPKTLVHDLQSWPTFVRRGKVAEMKAIAIPLVELLRSVPERVFGNDSEAMARFYEMYSANVAAAWFRAPNGLAESMARADFVLTRSGFQCLELNAWPNLGGWETAPLAKLHLETPVTAKFIADCGLQVDITDTLVAMLRHVIEDARNLFPDADQPLNVAFPFQLADARAPAEALVGILEPVFAQVCAQTGRSARSEIFCCLPEELELASDDSLHARGRAIQVVVLLQGAPIPAVYRGFKARTIRLYNGPACQVVSDKRTLALLSMLAETDRVDAEERRLIRAAVPWTRTTVVPAALAGACRAPRAEELIARRESLVLKAAKSIGGKGVHLGRATPEPVWAKLVGEALGSPRWVIQEYAESLPLLYQNGADGCCAHDVIWGPFVFGHSWGGMILRMQTKAAQAPVNTAQGATEGMLFELD